MTKDDDFGIWAVLLGGAGAALLALLSSMGPPKFPSSVIHTAFTPNQQVNSYQSSYSPPPPSKSGGCGCSAGK